MEALAEILTKLEHLERSLQVQNSTWLDLQGVADYLHISTSKLRKMISAGEIPFKRVGSNGKLIFNRKQIDLCLIYSKKTGFTKREREQAEAFI